MYRPHLLPVDGIAAGITRAGRVIDVCHLDLSDVTGHVGAVLGRQDRPAPGQ